jgi:hypothetical protein
MSELGIKERGKDIQKKSTKIKDSTVLRLTNQG